VRGVLHLLQVGQQQLRLDGGDVANGVHLAIHMRHVIVHKAADHLENRIHRANVGEELVAQPLPFAGPLDQARDIHQLEGGRQDGFARNVLVDELQPRIRHRHDAHVGLNRAKGIVARLRARGGQGIKQGAFADIRQSNNTSFHTRTSLPESGRD
jgi:hypothetical protein